MKFPGELLELVAKHLDHEEYKTFISASKLFALPACRLISFEVYKENTCENFVLDVDNFNIDTLQTILKFRDRKTLYSVIKRRALLLLPVADIYKLYSKILDMIEKPFIFEIFISDNRLDITFSNNYAFQCACGHGFLDIVKILLKNPKIDHEVINMVFSRACSSGNLDLIKILMNDSRIELSANDNSAIKSASLWGQADIVKLLLCKNVDPCASNNYCIIYSCMEGHFDVVKLLMSDKRVDPTFNDNHAIKAAAMNGHADVVELLLGDSRVDPTTSDYFTLRIACNCGYANIVKILLLDKRVDPTACDNLSIKWALTNGFDDIIQILLKNRRVSRLVRQKHFREALVDNELNNLNNNLKF
jgi:ankyrin repeat protein